MEVRSEVLQQATKEYIDEMFSKTELNLKNAINAVGAKMMVHNKLGQYLPLLANEQGLIDVDFLEEAVSEQVKKMGSIVVPAVGTSYKLNEDDIKAFFGKVRRLGD